MAIRSISNISCSLSLGLVYDISYDYSPTEGVKITAHFVNNEGVYPQSISLLQQKVNISVGNLNFNLYPATYEVNESSSSKVAKVDFIDDIFLLDHYYVTLKYRGCGQNVFQLGSPVDNRSSFQKQQEATDANAEKIKEFTEFPDLEYSFNDFLAVLRQKFPVNVSAFYDTTLTQSFVGTFKEVLNSWCSFYNLAYYFDNGILFIRNPATLQINLPSRPANAISYSRTESALNTYNTTAAFYYNQEGGELPLSAKPRVDADGDGIPDDEEDNDGDGEPDGESGDGEFNNLLIQYATLYPIGEEFNSIQQSVDMNQVVAAQFGPQFWFLYNYYKNTALEECGWQRTYLSDINNDTAIYQSISSLMSAAGLNANQGGIAFLNEKLFNAKYEFYYQYGQKIAGKYYYSLKRNSSVQDKEYTWFDNENQQITIFNEQTVPLKVDFLSSPISDFKIIEGTEINEYFQGLLYDGNRILYVDNYEINFEEQFALNISQAQQIKRFSENLINGYFGSDYLDYSELGDQVKYVVFADIPTQDLLAVVDFDTMISERLNLLQPRYKSFAIQGVKTDELSRNRVDPDVTPIINGNFNSLNEIAGAFLQDGGVVSNTNLNNSASNLINSLQNNQINPITTLGSNGTLAIREKSDLKMYYKKYSRCVSAASNYQNVYGRKFILNEASTDVPVIFRALLSNTLTYTLNRDFTYLNQYFNGALIAELSKGWDRNEITVSFSLNYLYDLGVSYISNGLTSFNLQVAGDGIRASYSFSNMILQVPTTDAIQQKIVQNIRSSAIRKYKPEEIIST